MIQIMVKRGKVHILQSRHTIEDKTFAACGRALLNRNIVEVPGNHVSCIICRNKLKLPVALDILAAAGFC